MAFSAPRKWLVGPFVDTNVFFDRNWLPKGYFRACFEPPVGTVGRCWNVEFCQDIELVELRE